MLSYSPRSRKDLDCPCSKPLRTGCRSFVLTLNRSSPLHLTVRYSSTFETRPETLPKEFAVSLHRSIFLGTESDFFATIPLKRSISIRWNHSSKTNYECHDCLQ